MIAYRIGKNEFIEDSTGTGAYLYGGRWNNKGVRMLYASQSRALAMAEASVHLPLNIYPTGYSIMELEFPNDMILELDIAELETLDWKTFPVSHITQEIGDAFIRNSGYLALKVPSIVVEGDFNFLLNPDFPNFADYVKVNDIKEFPFDKRFFVR